MDNKTRFLTFLFVILSIAFVVFVVIMQNNFTNPEFANAESNSETEDIQVDKEKDLVSNNDEEEDSDAEIDEVDTPTTKYVQADLLNVRSEPTLESEIVGTVAHNQEVLAEKIEDSDEWVKITTDDFTGYVKESFLQE